MRIPCMQDADSVVLRVVQVLNEQESEPTVEMLTVTLALLATELDERQRIPTGPAVKVDTTVPVVPAPAQVTVALPADAGAAPTPEATKVAHSLPRPSASPTAEPAAAELRA